MSSYPCVVSTKHGITIHETIPTTSDNPILSPANIGGYAHNQNQIVAITNSNVNIIDITSNTTSYVIDLPHIQRYNFSPSGRYLVLWQSIPSTYLQGANGSGPVKVQKEQQNTLYIYDLHKDEKEPIFTIIQKQIFVWPVVHFNTTETLMTHLSKTAIFYTVNDSVITKAPKQYANTIVKDFAWSPNSESPDTFAVFVPENKKQNIPAMLKVSHYPDVARCITSISFFKASESKIVWSPKGNVVFCKAQTNFDKTGQSYYGESTVHICSLADSSNNISIPKPDGPVYDAIFNNDGSLLASVSGFMPAVVEIFSVSRFGKLTSVKKFKNQSRNELKFSPNNQFLAVGGFGNCPGEMDVYETSKWKLVNDYNAHCTTEWHWTHDSKAIVFCGCYPRRHFDNFIKMCYIDGTCLPSVDYKDALYHLFLKPTAPIMDQVPFTVKEKKEEESAYVPPSMRGGKSAHDDSDPMPKPGQRKTKKATKKKTSK
ncbi:Eukaryotic translation initiation factor 2A [Entamoeba marina]